MKSLVITTVLLLGSNVAVGQASTWLTDEQSRDVATTAVHYQYPQPCYSTYRNERLEGVVVSLRRPPFIGEQLNNSVYFYRVSSDTCDYVIEKAGKPVRMTQVSSDCCEYGIVAVDRGTAKSYWFTGENRTKIFKEFATEQQIHPDMPAPVLFASLYRELVWGEANENEIKSLRELQEMVRQNFQSAYSPYERDNTWERKFEHWWRKFQLHMPHLRLETTYEPTTDAAMVRGYAFNGFALTIPRTDPPPKGTPQVFQWALLVKSDGTVERLTSKIIYSSR